MPSRSRRNDSSTPRDSRDRKRRDKRDDRSPSRTRSPSPAAPAHDYSELVAAINALRQSGITQHETMAKHVQELSINVDNNFLQVDHKINGVADAVVEMGERVTALEGYAKAPPAVPWPAGSSGTPFSAFPSAPSQTTAPAEALPTSGFNRKQRTNVITCNAHGNVLFTKSVATCFFNKLLADKGLDVAFVFDGNFEIGKKFSATFQGPGNVPSETVLTLLRSRKGPDGKWLPLTIKDPDGTDVRFYFDADKSPKTSRTESITNKFCNILRDKYGSEDPPGKSRFLCRKEEGKISFKGVTLCVISAEPDNATMQWNRHSDFQTSGIDKVAMSELFKSRFCIEWCS